MGRWFSFRSRVTLSPETPGMSATRIRVSGVSKISTAGTKTRPGLTRSPSAGASSLTLGCSSFSVMRGPPLSDLHFDLAGFHFFRLGHLDGQDTVFAGGFGFIALHLPRYGHA